MYFHSIHVVCCRGCIDTRQNKSISLGVVGIVTCSDEKKKNDNVGLKIEKIHDA